jgi:hypothetical protein
MLEHARGVLVLPKNLMGPKRELGYAVEIKLLVELIPVEGTNGAYEYEYIGTFHM